MTHLDADLALADAMPQILWIHDAAGAISYFNRQWTAYTGLTTEQTLAEGGAAQVHPADLGELQRLFVTSRDTDVPLEASYRLRRHDGVYRWHHARVVPFRRAGAAVTSWLGTAADVHDRHLLEQERAYLLRASKVLGTSLELDRTLADVARLVVPDVADWCAIDLLAEDGTLTRPAVAHVDPDKVVLAYQLWRRVPPRPDDAGGVYGVIRSGQPELTREITDAMLVAGLRDPELLAIYRELGLRSAMVVPLATRDRVVGALTLVTAGEQRLFDDRDLAFATELATRIAVAVENSSLYGEATRARIAAEAMAEEVREQSRTVEATLLELRRERDEARALRDGTP